MRRSRIGPAAFAAALLVCLVVALWALSRPVEAPGVQVQSPVFDPPPEFVEDIPPTTEPGPTITPHEWQRVTTSPEFAADRVRPRIPPSFPDELYLNNRLLLRQVCLDCNGAQMRISGDVITDFIVDRVPHSSGLPRGQLMGLEIEIAVFQYDKVIESVSPDGEPTIRPVGPEEIGRLVDGQMLSAIVVDTWNTFGTAHFELPPFERPLAPGLYRIEANLVFRRQSSRQLEALRWCSSLYGARTEIVTDPVTLKSETRLTKVIEDPDIHREVYTDLIENVGKVQDSASLLVGDLLQTPDLDENISRMTCIQTSYHQVIQQIQDYEYQLDNVERITADELKQKLSYKDVPEADRRNWIREALADQRRIRTQNVELIARNGGRTSTHEKLMLQAMDERREIVLQQISEFQDRLLLHYWIVLDGLLLYRGWHSINQPGYGAWDEITGRGHGYSRAARQRRLDEVRNAGGLQARWQHRRENWKYYPDEIVEIAFTYLRTKEETGVWDSDNFVRRTPEGAKLDSAAWNDLRETLVNEFLKDLQVELDQVKTTDRYANQALDKVYHWVTEARDDVLALAWSWEYYIRVDVQSEDSTTVKAEWKRFSEGVNGRQIAKLGAQAPGTLKVRFDTHIRYAKEALKLDEFLTRWRDSIDAGQTPPGR